MKTLEDIYQHTSARTRLDNLASKAFPIRREERQGDRISQKLFKTTIEEIFEEAEPKSGLYIDPEILWNPKFSDDVAPLTGRGLEQLNTLNVIREPKGLEMPKGKAIDWLIIFTSPIHHER